MVTLSGAFIPVILQNTEELYKELFKMKNKKRKRSMKTITVMLFLITALLWISLFLIKSIFWGIDKQAMIDDIISNILGILPPMLLIDFVYEYLTKENMADEIGEQITQTLIGSSDAIEAFKDEDKVKFVQNTVRHIVGDESAEMVNAVIDPYITHQYNIKNFFKYTIILRTYMNNPLFDDSKYFKVYEDLKYKKTYIGDCLSKDEINIAFIMKDHLLDSALRNQKFIFQENLSINEPEIKKLMDFSQEERINFVKDEMQFTLFIDDVLCTIKKVSITNDGIFISFISEHDVSLNSHSIEISFAMPQAKGRSEVLVSIGEPTYSPIIQLSYPETLMTVKAFSFLNEAKGASIEQASHNSGNYEFCIQDKWIYPMSGVVFVIDDITA